ncbi:putative peptidoglycan binding protein [Curtobacterium sp. PhB128]|nr:putative peptidoglycan binding protein [Curtobacterium sp. PhB171]ROQ29631.1 putative peptidoglycan binding protein [Curtobacterium sp. PhB170]ROS32358.1 putative peptidoglycan binding protein [Curtobacterium sp. PhB131]ROS73421.1 putative peptidoglycan binding protein [Curtobacterium sp. PhB141]TCL70842.1 putative peptidoglycan binding protein [Curtobacterium sp. PhB128]TCL89712.1 putative peptidoglycan binding protein [Curtobacterium sp. PhB138]
MGRRKPRWLRRFRVSRAVVGIAIVSMVVGAGLFWSGSVLFTRPADPSKQQSAETYTARKGTLEASVSLDVQASWPEADALLNRRNGTVTSVVDSAADAYRAGDELYAVDLQPVFLAEGTTPSFRTLHAGVSGPDVSQLQAMLAAVSIANVPQSGRFDAATEAGVRQWQTATMQKATGAVDDGVIIFVPRLPARVTLDEQAIAVGASLVGGATVGHVLAAAPSFAMTVAADQAALFDTGATVHISGPAGETWDARTEAVEPDSASDGVRVPLRSSGAGSVCGANCDQVALRGESTYSAKVLTADPVSGVLVAAACVRTDSSGAYVLGVGGMKIRVKVMGSAQGMAAVSNLKSGTKVLLPK